jgi:hypothetical protein
LLPLVLMMDLIPEGFSLYDPKKFTRVSVDFTHEEYRQLCDKVSFLGCFKAAYIRRVVIAALLAEEKASRAGSLRLSK